MHPQPHGQDFASLLADELGEGAIDMLREGWLGRWELESFCMDLDSLTERLLRGSDWRVLAQLPDETR